MSELVICPYCEKEMKQITNNHLKFKHSKTIEDLKSEFPDCKIISDVVKEKMKETFIKNYGVDNPSKSDKVKDKIKNTFIEKYGVTCSLHNPEIQEKVKKTNLERYGTETYFSSEDAKTKIEQSLIEKYDGNIRNSEEVNEKIKKTCMEKYGSDNPFGSTEIKEKIKKINIEKYGSSNISDLDFIKEKKKQTMMKKHLSNMSTILKSLNLEIVSEDYSGSKESYKWKCLKCGTIFETIWNYIQQEIDLCPTCFPKIPRTSKAENEIKEFIKSVGFEIIENDRNIIKPKELDIVIPELKIAIEYCGLYWHSDQQNKDSNYHIDKLESCNKKGYRLIIIFEDEWILNKDLVKNRLLHILNKNNSIRIHARKCEIREIPANLKNEFLNLFHIQSSDSSNIKLGAFHKNELVAVMTFSHGNISKGSKPKNEVWELNRFCTNYNYHIPGIASKMLEFFKKNYEWKLIFSYADRRWSSGNLYEQLGFILDKITKPNYWYIKGMERIHRFKLRKRPDEPKDIPESFLRLSEGYIKLFDCGSFKYILYNK